MSLQNRLEIERMLLNSVPAKQTILLDDWVLRLNGGYTYRANCVCPFHYDQYGLTEGRLAQCKEIFHRQNLPCVFKVTPSLQDGLSELLLQKGFQKIKTVYAMWGKLPSENYTLPESITYNRTPKKEWLNASARLTGIQNASLFSIHCSGIRNIAVKSIFVSAESEGKIIGCGYGTVENNYVGIYDLHVDPAFRKQGIGTNICHAVSQFGRNNGADTGYLIVHSKNENAIRLYRKMGFQRLYEYSFFQEPYAGTPIIDA